MGDGCQGNLLLDGWWLEFWGLLLLAAGDIERNPGPITGSQTSLIPDLIRVIYYCCVGEQLAKVDNRVLGKEYLDTVINKTSYTCVNKQTRRTYMVCLMLCMIAEQNGMPSVCLLEFHPTISQPSRRSMEVTLVHACVGVSLTG